MPDGFVDGGFDGLHVLPGEQAVKVDRHELRAHMEADVVAAEAAVDLAGNQALAGVLLHEVEAVGPVQGAVYLLPHREGGGAEVGGLPGLELGIEDGDGGAVNVSVPRLPGWPPPSGKKAVWSRVTAKRPPSGVQEVTVAVKWEHMGFS